MGEVDQSEVDERGHFEDCELKEKFTRIFHILVTILTYEHPRPLL